MDAGCGCCCFWYYGTSTTGREGRGGGGLLRSLNANSLVVMFTDANLASC